MVHSCDVPRYYFHVFNAVEVSDDEGQPFADLAAAKVQARETAAELICEELKAGRRIHPDHRIEVVDEKGQVVHVLRFGDLIVGGPGEEPAA